MAKRFTRECRSYLNLSLEPLYTPTSPVISWILHYNPTPLNPFYLLHQPLESQPPTPTTHHYYHNTHLTYYTHNHQHLLKTSRITTTTPQQPTTNHRTHNINNPTRIRS